MEYKEIDLEYGMLHMIKTKKFRSIYFKILLTNDLTKEEITKRNFLIDYLVLTTNKYKTKKELSLKIEDLYNVFIGGHNSRIGTCFTTRFYLSLLNPKYTEDTMLEESVELLHDILFEPNLKNKKFDSKIFKIIKNNIQKEIETIKEKSDLYANIRLREYMNVDKYSYQGFGYLEDLEKINEKNLYEYYQEFIKKTNVDIYVIGDISYEKISNLVREKLKFPTIRKPKQNVILEHEEFRQVPQKIIEESKFSQSTLVIGCKILNLNEFERKYVLNLYNSIFGAGFNSKLMQIVREKNSLAYYITSQVNKPYNILQIQSGISYHNYKQVLENIQMIMKDMENGNISEDELKRAKIEYLSILDEKSESQDNIIEDYISMDILNVDDIETRKKYIKKVTIEDLKNLSKKIHMDTIYLLKGDDNEKKEV